MEHQKQLKASSLTVSNELSDSDSSSGESSSCYQDSESEERNLCMSPPNNPRTNKKESKRPHSRKDRVKSRRRTRRNSDKSKNPTLINSAENIQTNESNDEIFQSLLQGQFENSNSKSAPGTADSNLHPIWPNLVSQTNLFLNSTPTSTTTNKKPISIPNKKHPQRLTEVDPLEREESIKRISLLLKLALSTRMLKEARPLINIPPPPTTPSTSLTQHNSFSSAFKSTFYSTQQSQTSTKYSSYSSYNTGSSASSLCIQENELVMRQQEKNQQSEQVWKEIYDFFEFYNDRALSDNTDLIDKRLSDARAQIPVIIKEIMSTNFYQITQKMNIDIKEKMRAPLSYLNLYEQKTYIDQLCYLYWIVEDVINRISYIETLYPSLQSMKRNEPAYADPQFEAVNKTLILWYKIMTELMTKSDMLGRFLGFAKKDENKPYWSWFDERLNYSRKEYDYVHKWLKQTFQTNRQIGMTSRSQSRSQVSSPVIDINKPMFPTSPNPGQRTLKQIRQISFELHASKKLEPVHTYLSEFSIMSDRNESRRGSNIHLTSGLNDKKKLSPNTLSPDSLLNDLLSKPETNHLEPVKIHHVTSFLSQNSLLSDSENARLYSTLQSKSFSSKSEESNMSSNNEALSTSPVVGFNLNDTTLELEALKLEVDDYDQSSASSVENASDSTTQTNPIIIEPPQNDNSAQMRQKILKEFLHKRLRKHGLTKTFDEIRKKVMNALPHALQTLQIDYCEYYNPMSSNNDPSNYHLIPLHKRYLEFMDMFPFDEETLVHGVRSHSFQKLNLPSFRPIFLYLNNIILELMHVCIKMQIEGKSDMKKQANFKFSLLSIEVLTHELRECIEQAILVRQFYYNMIYSVFDKCELDVQQQLENDLVPFDDDLKLIISIYLSFVTDWVHDLVACSDTFKAIGVLQDEWYFCKNNLYFVTASEDIYAKRFCALCKMVTSSLVDSLHDLDTKHKQPLMEYIANLELNQELNMSDLADDDSQLNSFQVEEIKKEENKVENEENTTTNTSNTEDDTKTNEEDYDEENQFYDEDLDLEINDEQNAKVHNRYIHLDPGAYDINLKCNEFKEEVNQLRKRCMKALGFCSNLIDDLSLAAKYTILKNKMQYTLDQLKQSQHVLVQFTNPELQSSQRIKNNKRDGDNQSEGTSMMIFVPQEFSKDKIQIARLLFLISAKDDYETNFLSENTTSTTKADTITNSFENSGTSLKNEKTLKSPKSKSIFRRLSSSNSFLEFGEDSQKNSILSKLSKLANMSTPTVTSTSRQASPQPPKFTNNYMLSPQITTDGYLLYLKIPNKIDESWEWTGNTIKLFAALPVRRALYQHKNPDTNEDTNKQVTLILVVPKPKLLIEKKFEVKARLKSSISLVKEKTSFHPNIEYAIDEVKDSILNLRSESAKSIRSIEKDLKTHYDTPISISRKSPIIYQRYLSEIWRVSYNFGIDLQNECIKFKTHDQELQFIQGLADFCIMWCEYILDKTERGKGKTVQPWAARKGIQLLQEAFHLSTSLTDSEYVKLRNSVERCLSHVIGDRTNSSSTPSSHKLDSSNATSEILTRSNTQSGINLNKNQAPSRRFFQSCMQADEKREHNLQDKRYIGKILNAQREQNIITATEVNFRWQLGLKIGEGQYGTVYSCVNLDTGEPMAMKEIPFKSNDIEAIKNIYSEINNLQGVRHENLVRLYGSELHRKEMLIFMEFCGDQCTLDRISKETSGLPEKIVRGYTKSLLEAVATLHENNIMHRDIKGSNIFLKVIDSKHPEKIVLKLGDFGCSIKFKDIIGSSPAKATGFMGTFPFMAPEVMTSGGAVNAGYTISADIWSLGCVVIEMFTGKRPWHPLSDENILYKIHIQKPPVLKPPYPTQNTISEEAVHFLDACLEFEPNKRLTADQLLNHPFVKVHEPLSETPNDYFSL